MKQVPIRPGWETVRVECAECEAPHLFAQPQDNGACKYECPVCGHFAYDPIPKNE